MTIKFRGHVSQKHFCYSQRKKAACSQWGVLLNVNARNIHTLFVFFLFSNYHLNIIELCLVVVTSELQRFQTWADSCVILLNIAETLTWAGVREKLLTAAGLLSRSWRTRRPELHIFTQHRKTPSTLLFRQDTWIVHSSLSVDPSTI